MGASSEQLPAPPVTEQREFWVLIAYAAALGVFAMSLARGAAKEDAGVADAPGASVARA